ncbi:hypothetical protein COT30_03220 [Candidatus Micrarchaeota archaeon CG08_land_8_20_14_0_20_49_17]|nr:MAG: hypothetical protein COT30_03220 [Candidatus Micrarchaeota archaeon CG08_land_8_20_14_0_20_49_17]PIZ92828.1 MAG: hypothetical protein COX84_06400 [Candidatus Micrarchaeota archaeon CG_4_10_14_0_2_um_filter_49_7]HII54369.1 site-2 protease family protein [Candidatus Micrarchaeota archaeon]
MSSFLEVFYFDTDELMHIACAVLALTLAFTLLGQVPANLFMLMFFLNLVTVGLGVVLHELAHKFVAIRYGAFARFIAWPAGLALMIIMAAMHFPLLIAAPGAVYIFTPLGKKEYGIVSVAGPLTNIALSLIFAAAMFPVAALTSAMPGISTYLMLLLASGAQINAWLAVFNMLPIPPLDGSKVLPWDGKVYAGVIVFALLLVFIIVPLLAGSAQLLFG